MIKIENAQPGTIVKVFQDPVTEKKFEGKAVLLHNVQPHGGIDGAPLSDEKALMQWVVKFLDTKEKVYRFILVSGKFFS